MDLGSQVLSQWPVACCRGSWSSHMHLWCLMIIPALVQDRQALFLYHSHWLVLWLFFSALKLWCLWAAVLQCLDWLANYQWSNGTSKRGVAHLDLCSWMASAGCVLIRMGWQRCQHGGKVSVQGKQSVQSHCLCRWLLSYNSLQISLLAEELRGNCT